MKRLSVPWIFCLILFLTSILQATKAQFTDANTIKGMTYAELAAIAGFETALEGVLDLSDLQGAVTDGQVPNDITVDLAATVTTNANLTGDVTSAGEASGITE